MLWHLNRHGDKKIAFAVRIQALNSLLPQAIAQVDVLHVLQALVKSSHPEKRLTTHAAARGPEGRCFIPAVLTVLLAKAWVAPACCAVALLAAVSSWVGTRLAYVSGSSLPTDGATRTLLNRRGVCRDYSHLCVALH